ncbi:MAG: methyltransferase domain-containing protein [Chromatiales bacterium]|nr:methyltransferase domain-containing protein [Chromatiales bacterium]
MYALTPLTRRMRARFAHRAHAFLTSDYLARKIEAILFEHLEAVRLDPTVIVDAGSGPGRMLPALRQRFPTAQHVLIDSSMEVLGLAQDWRPWRKPKRICADLRSIPLLNQSVELVLSNLALNAVSHDLKAAFSSFARIQPPDGLLAFSMLGPASLRELRQPEQISPFPDMHDVGDAMVAAGYADVVMDCERLTIEYQNPGALLAEASALSLTGPPFHSMKKTSTKRLHRALEQQLAASDGGPVSLTLEVTFGHGWVPRSRTSQDVMLSFPAS